MYDKLPYFVFGFHGCDQAVAEKVFAGKSELLPSENDYDWLGHGVYFWENNPARALEYARELQNRSLPSKQRIWKPTVIGAVIDLGLCLNLLDSNFLRLVKDGYKKLRKTQEEAGVSLPENKPVGGSKDMLLRNLDCAVIETVHQSRAESGEEAFDSVRGLFEEGEALYPGAGFREKNHIQICVRRPSSISGYFRPRL